MTKELQIEGMMCEHCKKHVEEAIQEIPGVTAVEVSLEKNNAVVTSEREIETKEFDNAIEEAGYKLLNK